MKKLTYFYALVLMLMMFSCENAKDSISIDFEQYKLENGLDVILQEDSGCGWNT